MKFLRWIWSFFRKKTLENGEIVYCDDGIYQRCPKCNQLVAKAVHAPEFGEELQPLFDLRGCKQGFINFETGQSTLLPTCDMCGSYEEKL